MHRNNYNPSCFIKGRTTGDIPHIPRDCPLYARQCPGYRDRYSNFEPPQQHSHGSMCQARSGSGQIHGNARHHMLLQGRYSYLCNLFCNSKLEHKVVCMRNKQETLHTCVLSPSRTPPAMCLSFRPENPNVVSPWAESVSLLGILALVGDIMNKRVNIIFTANRVSVRQISQYSNARVDMYSSSGSPAFSATAYPSTDPLSISKDAIGSPCSPTPLISQSSR